MIFGSGETSSLIELGNEILEWYIENPHSHNFSCEKKPVSDTLGYEVKKPSELKIFFGIF